MTAWNKTHGFISCTPEDAQDQYLQINGNALNEKIYLKIFYATTSTESIFEDHFFKNRFIWLSVFFSGKYLGVKEAPRTKKKNFLSIKKIIFS